MNARPDLDRLAALAAAATPGPWRVGPKMDGMTTIEASAEGGGGISVADSWETMGKQDATFIAACDPATLRWLVERVRELEVALTKVGKVFPNGPCWCLDDLSDQHDVECVAARAALSDTEAEPMKRDDRTRCDERTSGAGCTFPQCRYRWAVNVVLSNGDRRRVCRVHLRPLNRQGLVVEATSGQPR